MTKTKNAAIVAGALALGGGALYMMKRPSPPAVRIAGTCSTYPCGVGVGDDLDVHVMWKYKSPTEDDWVLFGFLIPHGTSSGWTPEGDLSICVWSAAGHATIHEASSWTAITDQINEGYDFTWAGFGSWDGKLTTRAEAGVVYDLYVRFYSLDFKSVVADFRIPNQIQATTVSSAKEAAVDHWGIT